MTILLSGIKGDGNGGTSSKYKSSGLTSYWIDISEYNSSILPSDFSPIYYNGGVNGSVYSSTLYESRPGARFSTPFACVPSYPFNGSVLGATILVCDERTDGLSLQQREVSSCDSMIFIDYLS